MVIINILVGPSKYNFNILRYVVLVCVLLSIWYKEEEMLNYDEVSSLKSPAHHIAGSIQVKSHSHLWLH